MNTQDFRLIGLQIRSFREAKKSARSSWPIRPDSRLELSVKSSADSTTRKQIPCSASQRNWKSPASYFLKRMAREELTFLPRSTGLSSTPNG